MDGGHRSLRVWRGAMDLAESVYGFTSRFPRSEVYGLASQLTRAAVSVPSNIAEGYGRGGRDYERFVSMAYGSLLELETQLEIATRAKFVAAADAEAIRTQATSVGRQLNALRAGLRRSRIRSDP